MSRAAAGLRRRSPGCGTILDRLRLVTASSTIVGRDRHDAEVFLKVFRGRGFNGSPRSRLIYRIAAARGFERRRWCSGISRRNVDGADRSRV